MIKSFLTDDTPEPDNAPAESRRETDGSKPVFRLFGNEPTPSVIPEETGPPQQRADPEQETRTAAPPPVTADGVGLFEGVATDPTIAPAAEPTVENSSFRETAADTFRRTGMAWSAGIAFLGAVVFMLVLGWGADVLFGSSPWGIVLGIVLGSAIGFIQFFRISSQIFKK